MTVECVWEHNGNDTLLYAVNLPGAYTRGENKTVALAKMPTEARSYLLWAGESVPTELSVKILQDAPCELNISDADSDVLFHRERDTLTLTQYNKLKTLVMKSAEDFLTLYNSIPCKDESDLTIRNTFYGQIPRTAREMYLHTKNVNAYYFGEIGVDADNEGSILQCRSRGFEALEATPDFLENSVFEGSYGELWTLRKVLRRFLWHDRIHAKAMYRMAVRVFGQDGVFNPFGFE